jgi:putative glycosyltransferase (TIGR04348 family)
MPAKPVVRIVTPGTRSANNGNWRTAVRWAEMLRDRCRVIVQTGWDGEATSVLVALHALRSASAVARYRAAHPSGALIVVLTGTDLYRDLPASPEAAACLDMADRIVVLQEDALALLAPRWRAKARVIFQSAPLLEPRRKIAGTLHCVAVGHLRAEKDPATLFRAMALVPRALPITLRHIGAALDPALGRAARALEKSEPRYRYSEALSHGLTRAALGAAHLLVHPSVIEGGANVIVEAVTAGTPVLASRISGNLGMLGTGYPGYFEPGDASGLAARLVLALESPTWLATLGSACDRRRALFKPAAEERAVNGLVAEVANAARR